MQRIEIANAELQSKVQEASGGRQDSVSKQLGYILLCGGGEEEISAAQETVDPGFPSSALSVLPLDRHKTHEQYLSCSLTD